MGLGAAFEMYTSPEPWPVVTAADELRLCTLGPPNPAEQPEPDTWIASLGSLPLLAQPGERWLYNTGASVLGVLVARAAGTTFSEVLSTRIFAPLAMSNTSLSTTDTDRLATAYVPTAEGLDVWDPPDGAWSTPPAFGDGASGLVSTVDDLLSFARMLLRGGGPVLSPDAVSDMTRDQLTSEQKARAAKVSSATGAGVLPVRRHRRPPCRRFRLERRPRHLLARRSREGPQCHRADTTLVRDPRAAPGAPRPATSRLRGPRLSRTGEGNSPTGTGVLADPRPPRSSEAAATSSG